MATQKHYHHNQHPSEGNKGSSIYMYMVPFLNTRFDEDQSSGQIHHQALLE